MWRQPSVSKRTLSECDKEKATGGSAPVVITVCCNSVILSCQNLGPEITPLHVFFEAFLCPTTSLLNCLHKFRFLHSTVTDFQGKYTMPELQIFTCSSKTVPYPALLPPLLQERCFSWEEFYFLTYQHLPLHVSVFPLTLLQSHCAKILEKMKCCMC